MEKKMKVVGFITGIVGILTSIVILCIFLKCVRSRVKRIKGKLGLILDYYSKKMKEE